jgi:hypothetical protein
MISPGPAEGPACKSGKGKVSVIDVESEIV